MGERTRSRLAWAVATVAILGVLGGCLALVAGPTPPEGDCNARLRHGGRTYEPVVIRRLPERDVSLGRGTMLDCDGTSLGPRGKLRAFVGVPAEDAVWWSGGPYASRRDTLISRPVPCVRPAEFTGQLLCIGGHTPARAGVRPPYAAVFRAHRGTGLPLEGMRWVQVRARVTSRTVVRVDSLHETRVGKDRVHVRTRCRGDRFVAERVVRLARAPGPS